VYAVVNVGDLGRFDGEVTLAGLIGAGLVRKNGTSVKILGNGDLKKALTVRAHQFSKSAAEKIVAAGGKAEIISAEAKTGRS